MYDEYSYSFFNYDDRSKVDTMLQTVVDEFFDAKTAERLSPNTLSDYRNTLRKFTAFIGEKNLEKIEAKDIRAFLATLGHLTKKTVKNHWIALSSLWTWAVGEGYAKEHVVRRVRPPRPDLRTVVPLKEHEVKNLLEMRTKHTLRNKAIIFVLLDTGVRASELCGLRIDDISSTFLRVMGKGDRERMVPLSGRSWKALLDYLKDRQGVKDNSLFASDRGTALTRSGLRQILNKLGEMAGVDGVYPHRFRHTFAINYLRNGGDGYTLQLILGHSSMDMVKRYLALADADVGLAHRKASPVQGWNL